MPKPDFFIVGAPKCGTTAMFTYLREHPEVFMAKKEYHFFGSDLRPAAYNGPKRVLDNYLALFSQVNGEKRIGEASVWYLASTHAAREIKAFAPEADIIIMLRNPVDMMYSLYSMFLWINDAAPGGVVDKKTGKALSFDEALKTQDARKALYLSSVDEEAVAGTKGLRLFHTDAAMYTDQVKRYLDAFGREHVHIIFYDDLKADAARVYRDTLSFLGVDPTFQAAFDVINSNRKIQDQRLHGILRDHSSLGVLRKIGRTVVPTPLRKRVFSMLMQRNVKQQARTPMKPETRRWLQDQFRPEVKRLGDLLDQDLVSRWPM